MLKRLGNAVIQAPAKVSWSRDNAGPYITVTFDVIDGALQCREVVVRARPGQPEIKQADIRSVPINDLREQVAEFWSMPYEHSEGGTTLQLQIGDESRERFARANLAATRRRSDAETLQRVADVYLSNDHAPTQAVADAFDVAHRTAGLYVQRAREAKLLPPVKRGK